MDFLVITVSNLIWMFYCLTEGVREGFFNHYKNAYRRNEHYDFKKVFFIQRLLVLLATGGIMMYTIGLIALPIVIGQAFMFHWLHKISYNCVSKRLDYIQETNSETKSILESTKKIKSPLILLGITIQIFVYLFFM